MHNVFIGILILIFCTIALDNCGTRADLEQKIKCEKGVHRWNISSNKIEHGVLCSVRRCFSCQIREVEPYEKCPECLRGFLKPKEIDQ